MKMKNIPESSFEPKDRGDDGSEGEEGG